MSSSVPRPPSSRPSSVRSAGDGPEALLPELAELDADVSSLLARIGIAPDGKRADGAQAAPARSAGPRSRARPA